MTFFNVFFLLETRGNFSLIWDGSVSCQNGEDGSGLIFKFLLPKGSSRVELSFGKRMLEGRFTPCQGLRDVIKCLGEEER